MSHLLYSLFYFLGIGAENTISWAFHNFRGENNRKQVVLAWIHSHVQSVKCNFSSVDVHTQHTFAKIHDGILGLVIELKENGNLGQYDFFEMSLQGKRLDPDGVS